MIAISCMIIMKIENLRWKLAWLRQGPSFAGLNDQLR